MLLADLPAVWPTHEQNHPEKRKKWVLMDLVSSGCFGIERQPSHFPGLTPSLPPEIRVF